MTVEEKRAELLTLIGRLEAALARFELTPAQREKVSRHAASILFLITGGPVCSPCSYGAHVHDVCLPMGCECEKAKKNGA